jgi:hypothetical protein
MAMPTMFDPNQTLYLTKISMGSQFKGKSKDIDDYTREIKYEHCKETRREIGAIRQVINSRRSFCSMPFFGAYFTNQLGKDQLIDACKKADLEMKEIDPSLHCTPVFIKIDMPDLASGSQFDALLSTIRIHVHGVALKRIEEHIQKNEGKALTPKSQKSLLLMLTRMDGLNIISDPGVTADIQKMRDRVMANQINELKEDLLIIMDEARDRGAALEIPDMSPAVQSEEDQPKKVLLATGNKPVLDI